MKRWQRWWTTVAITKILTINDCGRKFAGRHLQTAITYIIDPNKTQNMRYVTGINCQPGMAFDQMLATKQKFGKTDKRQGYHIIISFEEEDVEPGLLSRSSKNLRKNILVKAMKRSMRCMIIRHIHTDILFLTA